MSMVEKISLSFDADDLTIGDLEDFEDVAGLPLFEALKEKVVKDDDGLPVRDDDGRPVKEIDISPKTMKALVWITKRREDPTFTVEDARNVKVTSIDLGGDEGNDEGQDETAETV